MTIKIRGIEFEYAGKIVSDSPISHYLDTIQWADQETKNRSIGQRKRFNNKRGHVLR